MCCHFGRNTSAANVRRARALKLVFLFLTPWLVTAVAVCAVPPTEPAAYNRLLGRGINLGNALEAPREGEWGVTVRPEYLDAIRAAGFTSVRVPIRWSAHAGTKPPYTVDPVFLRRVDEVVDHALRLDLAVVFNVHHFHDVDKDPQAHADRLAAIWRQIAQHYAGRSDRLAFELLNEPHDNLTAEAWNELFPRVLREVRRTNPTRIVIIDAAEWGSLAGLLKLRLPEDDRWLIATFHYYLPFEFTHQGAEWLQDNRPPVGRPWSGSPAEVNEVESHMQAAADWGRKHGRPVFMGEFGAYSKADIDSRIRWTATVARQAEKSGLSWAYWEFGAGFGAYDRDKKAWRQPLLKALLP